MRLRLRLIVVLVSILILQSCISYERLSESGKLRKGMSKQALEEAVMFANQFQHPFAASATREFYESRGIEIIAPATNSQAFVFTSVWKPSDPPLVCLELVCDLNVGNGRLDSWHPNFEAAKSYVARNFGPASRSNTNSANAAKPISRPKEKVQAAAVVKKKKPSLDPKPARPKLVTEMWEELKKSRNPETLLAISFRCSALISRYGEVSFAGPTSLDEWGIDSDVISSWSLEVQLLKWPRSTWENPLDFDEFANKVGPIQGRYMQEDHEYGFYLIQIDKSKNNQKMFIEYMDLNERELNLCEQIARNY